MLFFTQVRKLLINSNALNIRASQVVRFNLNNETAIKIRVA